MNLRTLHFRLLAAAAITTGMALIAAGFGLSALFEQHVGRQLDEELEIYLKDLIGHIEPDGKGGITLKDWNGDPRFGQPLSGRYWQIQDDDQHLMIRSRSLWDSKLDLPQDKLDLGVVHRHELTGPTGQPLLVREEQIILLPETEARRLRFAVAIDRSNLLAARKAFSQDLLPYLLLLAFALMGASWLQIKMGLSPLDRIRRGVQNIRSGKEKRLDHNYPEEIRPLTDEINELLQCQEKTVADARAWTADLAHGLKTPLTALGSDAQRLRTEGHGEMADNLEQLALDMKSRVDRELIRARLRSETIKPPRHTDLVETIQAVVKTLMRTPLGERLVWDLNVPDKLEVSMARDDLTELIGNLLDNACKWARQRIEINVRLGKDTCLLIIGDDGPGVDPDQLERLGERGLRLDEQTRGYGLGLAIARDIVDAYRGGLEFSVSELGGLAAKLTLPRTRAEAPLQE